MAPGCALQAPCSEKISGNCLICTFCALLNFELRFFFFRQTKALYASNSLFHAPIEELSIQKKIVRALDLWWCVFQGPHTGKEHRLYWNRMSKASASTRPRFPFSPLGAEGEGDRQTLDCFHLCVCSMLWQTHKEGQWLLMLKLSKQWKCAQQSSAKPTFLSQKLNTIEWQLS